MEVRVGRADEFPEGSVRIVQSGTLFLGIYRIDGAFYAIEDRCSHDDGPLCEGDRDGFDVICPRHGARFDVTTGRATCMPAVVPVKTYAVRVEGGEVQVNVP